jgi:uncharacterized protein with PQ loop repeat
MPFNLVWAALAVSVFSTVPQLLQIIKTQEARDFNTLSVFLSMLSNSLIGIQATRIGDRAALALSMWLFVYWSIILSYKLFPPTNIILRSQGEGEF